MRRAELVERHQGAIREIKMEPVTDKLSLEILEYWNSKNIMIHRKCSRIIPITLRRIMKDYTKEEILKSIDNYATVYFDRAYFFNHKWKLEEFLQAPKALPDFMDDGVKWLNYMDYDAIKPNPKPKKEVSSIIIEPIIPMGDTMFVKDIYPAMLKSLKTMPYDEYLQTEHWLHFKTEALKHAQFKCHICNTKDTKLHVHHNNYDNRGRETFNDVTVLCGGCHARFHGK